MFDGDCVPMNADRWTLAELSALPVQLDLRVMKKPRLLPRIVGAMDAVQNGYFAHGIFSPRRSTYYRVYRKLFDALEFFRRAHRPSGSEHELMTSLAAAFEVLLADNYTRGRQETRIEERLRLALRGQRGSLRMVRAWRDVFDVRNAFLHTGRVEGGGGDLREAREAFVYAFLGVAERLRPLPPVCDAPIGFILGE